jgi:ceramide glucosyltransferase
VTWALGVLVAYVILRVASAWTIGVAGMQDENLRKNIGLLLLRDAFAFVVWVASFFPQRIFWRGKQFQVRDKRLIAIADRQS